MSVAFGLNLPKWVSTWINCTFGLCRVDTLAERIGADIDSSLKQTINPVVEQLSNKAHNVRESLGIWNRPFSPLSSGHPNPVIPPNPNLANQNEGSLLLKFRLFLTSILLIEKRILKLQVQILLI